MNDQPSPVSRKQFEETITITAVFGSEIQRDVSMKVLWEFLEAWRQNVQSAHKKNKITLVPEHR